MYLYLEIYVYLYVFINIYKCCQLIQVLLQKMIMVMMMRLINMGMKLWHPLPVFSKTRLCSFSWSLRCCAFWFINIKMFNIYKLNVYKNIEMHIYVFNYDILVKDSS